LNPPSRKWDFAPFSLLDASKSLRIFFTVFDLLVAFLAASRWPSPTLGIVNTLVIGNSGTSP